MGQRLNLEIVDNNGVLANSYYHWSAYTGSAIELTEAALGAFYDSPEDISQLGLAVFMLQETGAGLYSEEKERISADETEMFNGIEFRDARDRNCGLLSVTKSGIEETERWEEGRVTVNIEDRTVDFSVIWTYTAGEYNEDMGDEDAYDSLPSYDCPMSGVSFDEFYTIRTAYEDHPEGFVDSDGYVVTWIG